MIIESRYGNGRSASVEDTNDGMVSRKELIRMAIQLREDLLNYAEKVGSCRDVAEVMNSAGALIIAITEPEVFRLSAALTRKMATVYPFPPGTRCG